MWQNEGKWRQTMMTKIISTMKFKMRPLISISTDYILNKTKGMAWIVEFMWFITMIKPSFHIEAEHNRKIKIFVMHFSIFFWLLFYATPHLPMAHLSSQFVVYLCMLCVPVHVIVTSHHHRFNWIHCEAHSYFQQQAPSLTIGSTWDSFCCCCCVYCVCLRTHKHFILLLVKDIIHLYDFLRFFVHLLFNTIHIFSPFALFINKLKTKI